MQEHDDRSGKDFDNEPGSLSKKNYSENLKTAKARLSEQARRAFSDVDDQDETQPDTPPDVGEEQESASPSWPPHQPNNPSQSSTSDPGFSCNTASGWSNHLLTPARSQGYGQMNFPAQYPFQTEQMQHANSPRWGCQGTSNFFSPPEKYKKRMSAEEKQRAILYFLEQTYQASMNQAGNVMLVERRTGTLFPSGTDEVRKQAKAYFFYQHNLEISNSAITSALDKFTESSCVQLSLLPVFGRAGCMKKSLVRVINSHHGSFKFTPASALPIPPWSADLDAPFIVPHRSQPLVYDAHLSMDYISDFEQRFLSETGLPKNIFLLVVAWMVLAWMPDKKQVILEMRGNNDESQRHAQRLIKKLIDPSRSQGDIALPSSKVAFEKHVQQDYLLSLEHINSLTTLQQKWLFEFLQGKEVDWVWKDGKKTGMKVNIQCPVVMSCLESPLTYAPLIERKVSVDTATRSHHIISRHIDDAVITPISTGFFFVFGFVQHGLISYFWHYKNSQKEGVLADFCTIGELVSAYFGKSKDEFWSQLNNARLDIHEDALEEDIVAKFVMKSLEDNGGSPIEMSVTEWLEFLAEYIGDEASRSMLPKTQKALSIRFKKAKGVLKPYGILLQSVGRQERNRRAWRVEKAPDPRNLTPGL